MANKTVIPFNEIAFDDSAQILDAIRTGGVDAFVIEERDGHTVYTLANTDLPYSALVQRMQQGAAMLNSDGRVVFCNPSLAALLGTRQEDMAGLPFEDVILPDDRPVLRKLIQELQNGSCEGELRLRRFDQSFIPARFSLTTLSRDSSITGVLVTDLTSEKSYAELASRIQSVQDEERKKIARELHDSVGQLLSAIGMNLSRLQNESRDLSSTSANLLSDSASMVDQVTREIRTISHLLHPPLLDLAGLESAIRWYVDGFSHRSNINVDLQTDSDLGRLPDEVEICLFRVVQECLTNVYRHSGGDSCSISIRRDGQVAHLDIHDNGHGFPKAAEGQSSAGVGLRGMQERLRPLGCFIQVPSTESGTTVIVVVPVPPKSEG